MSLSGTLALLVSTIGTANIFTSGLFTYGADASEAELVLEGSTEGAVSSGAALALAVALELAGTVTGRADPAIPQAIATTNRLTPSITFRYRVKCRSSNLFNHIGLP